MSLCCFSDNKDKIVKTFYKEGYVTVYPYLLFSKAKKKISGTLGKIKITFLLLF